MMLLRKRTFLLLVGVLGLAAFFYWPEKRYACESLAAFGAHTAEGRCIIPGDLHLEGAIDGLPPNLVIQGDLSISGTSIDELPIGLIVEGKLELYKTSIGTLPERLLVKGDFDNYLGFGSPAIKCDEIPPSVVIQGRNLGCSE